MLSSYLKSPKFYKLLIVIFSIVFGYSVFDYFQYESERTKCSINLGKSKNKEVKVVIDKNINHFEKITKKLAQKISNSSYNKDQLTKLIVETSGISNLGLGVTVAFEPFEFIDTVKLFCPFYDKKLEKLIDISEVYDYTERGNVSTDWYTKVIDSKQPIWSKPYYAKGAKQLVSDYGVPILKKYKNGEEKIVGMVSYTLSLERLSKYVNEISLGASGFGYIATTDLELVTHPSMDLLINPEKVKKIVELEPKFKRFSSEKEGHFKMFSYYTFQDSDIYFSTLENGWIISVVFNSVDLLGSAFDLDNKIIHVLVSFSITLLFVFLLLFKVLEGRTRNIWAFSLAFSMIAITNIILIWFINIHLKKNKEDIEPNKITNKTALNNYLSNRNNELQKIGYPNSIEIPTGVYVNNVTFKNAYEVALGGKIWQKFNDTLEVTHDLNFVFPQKASSGISVRTSIVSKTHVDDYWLYRYNFTATIKFDFDYSRYPLDFRLLNLELMYPDIHENRILVPDLDGYRLLNPGNMPGIQTSMYIPEATITSSYFNFSKRDFNSNLGNVAYDGSTHAPVLVFNMLVKRKIINPVISNILPIFVIAILIFLLLFTINKVNGELKEGSALTVIQALGGFFFVLLLSHIQLRRSLLTPDLSYLESFYFVMYGIIALVSSGILLYVKTNIYKFLEYKNCIILKLLYWPVLLFSIYMITLYMFY